MNIACPECKSRFRISDEKIPKLEGAVLACPKCGSGVPVDTGRISGASTAEVKEEALTYDASKKPFDFLDAGSRTAIACVTETAVLEAVCQALGKMGYSITEAQDAREALRNMWYHTYHLVLLDELFDTQNPEHNRVLAYLESLSMAQRREMVVALFSRSLRTMDEMGAFQKSVNVIINVKHLPDTSRILSQAIREHHTFYQVYRDLRKKETAL